MFLALKNGSNAYDLYFYMFLALNGSKIFKFSRMCSSINDCCTTVHDTLCDTVVQHLNVHLFWSRWSAWTRDQMLLAMTNFVMTQSCDPVIIPLLFLHLKQRYLPSDPMLLGCKLCNAKDPQEHGPCSGQTPRGHRTVDLHTYMCTAQV